MPKKIHDLTNLRIEEISLVDQPANPGATVAFFKRAGTALASLFKGAGAPATGGEPDAAAEFVRKADRYVSMLGHSLASIAADTDIEGDAGELGAQSVEQFAKAVVEDAVQLAGIAAGDIRKSDDGVMSFADAIAEQAARERVDRAMSGFYDLTSALRQSVSSILRSQDADKRAKVAQSVEQFRAAVAAILSGLTGEVSKPAHEAGHEGGEMAKREVLKAGISKLLADTALATLAKALDAALDATKDEALDDFEKALNDAVAADATLRKERDEAVQKAKAASETEDGVIKKALAGLSETERKVFEKALSAGGEAKAEVAKLLDDRAREAMIAKAKDFSRLAKADEFGPLLHELNKAAPEATAKLLTMLAPLAKQVEEADRALGPVGVSGEASATGDAYQKLVAKAAELQRADPKLTKEQAFTKVYADPANADLVTLYKSERRRAA